MTYMCAVFLYQHEGGFVYNYLHSVVEAHYLMFSTQFEKVFPDKLFGILKVKHAENNGT